MPLYKTTQKISSREVVVTPQPSTKMNFVEAIESQKPTSAPESHKVRKDLRQKLLKTEIIHEEDSTSPPICEKNRFFTE